MSYELTHEEENKKILYWISRTVASKKDIRAKELDHDATFGELGVDGYLIRQEVNEFFNVEVPDNLNTTNKLRDYFKDWPL